jgi:hypothetical protein
VTDPEYAPVPDGDRMPDELRAQMDAALVQMLSGAGGALNGHATAVDCGPRPADGEGLCGAGLVDPAWRKQHWCHEAAGHDNPTHVCPNGDATWVEVGAEPADPDTEWNGPMRP